MTDLIITQVNKSANISVIYGLLAFLSIGLLVAYLLLEKRRNNSFVWLFSCVATVNTGYFLLSISPSLSFALAANALSYFGAAYSILIMLYISIDVCKVPFDRKSKVLLSIVSSISFLLAASGPFMGLYYKQVGLQVVNGVARLVKIYGPLHFVYTVYLLSYFVMMALCVVYAKKRKTIYSSKYAVFLASVVLGNLFVWAVEQLIDVQFEFLSVSYIATEVFLLLVYGILQDSSTNLKPVCPVSDADKYNCELPPNIEELFLAFSEKLQTLSGAEKRIFDYYLEGYEISDIPELAFVSIHTVKKHNRSIYQKLGVASRDDLMLYIELFRRCGRLSELK